MLNSMIKQCFAKSVRRKQSITTIDARQGTASAEALGITWHELNESNKQLSVSSCTTPQDKRIPAISTAALTARHRYTCRNVKQLLSYGLSE